MGVLLVPEQSPVTNFIAGIYSEIAIYQCIMEVELDKENEHDERQ